MRLLLDDLAEGVSGKRIREIGIVRSPRCPLAAMLMVAMSRIRQRGAGRAVDRVGAG